MLAALSSGAAFLAVAATLGTVAICDRDLVKEECECRAESSHAGVSRGVRGDLDLVSVAMFQLAQL